MANLVIKTAIIIICGLFFCCQTDVLRTSKLGGLFIPVKD